MGILKLKPGHWYTLAGLIIAGLIGVQVYWISNSISMQKLALERRLKEDVDLAVEAVEEDAFCFTFYSRAYMKPGEGMYMLKQKWDDGFIGPERGGFIDTLNLYNVFPTTAERDTFIKDNSIWFERYPATVDVTMRFSYVGLNPNMKARDVNNYEVKDINSSNFKDKLQNNFTIDQAIDISLLNSEIKTVLTKNKIDTSYAMGIYNQQTAKYEYLTTGANPKQLDKNSVRTQMLANKFSKPYELRLFVPDSFMSVVRSLLVMMVSSLIIIVLLVSAYVYFIRTILNQKKLSEMKNSFINNITHEFRTPITNINLAIENWHGKDLNGSAQYLRIIAEENKHMERNVEQILQLATLESDVVRKYFARTNIHTILHEALSSFSIQTESAKGKIELKENAKNPYLYCNAQQIKNMLQNLIDNAIKYRSNKPPHIIISTYETGSHFVIQVDDNGIGMSGDTQQYIFNRFYRGHTGDRHDVKGFGLGLSYVKYIVEAHEGEINVKSKTGQGTCFTIYLPKSLETI
ncbi:hypothetical protein CAP35_08880 [Chitinophagaceae bacterium IBVUCB1]|nr:hypothetical protein CAP35_08880 [Chitinophagaceae bacterium IBVUCB1]